MSAGGPLVQPRPRVAADRRRSGHDYNRLDLGDVDCGSRPSMFSAPSAAGPRTSTWWRLRICIFDHAGPGVRERGQDIPNARRLAAQELSRLTQAGTHRADRATPWHVISRSTAAYSSSLDLINDDDEIFPNVRADGHAGHSPGFTRTRIASRAGRRLVALGDAFHTPGQSTYCSGVPIDRRP